ncbi:MAG: DUF3786 domain-containing protein [Desulfobacterales bacterium]|nr:DUF3786 domain-containing protein [Desulfobacterales bacterium]
MSYNIDPIHFKDLAATDPDDIVQRTGAVFDSAASRIILPVWGHDYVIDPARQTVSSADGFIPAQADYMFLFIVHYLLGSTSAPASGEWVSEKDLPGGAAFFRGPHTLPTDIIVRAFGDDLERFSKTCSGLGGQPMDMADAAFSFDIRPDIPVAVLYWQGDADFGAEAKLLFDRSISRHLALDIVYALAVMVCKTLG